VAAIIRDETQRYEQDQAMRKRIAELEAATHKETT
jgi:hypothetical protein